MHLRSVDFGMSFLLDIVSLLDSPTASRKSGRQSNSIQCSEFHRNSWLVNSVTTVSPREPSPTSQDLTRFSMSAFKPLEVAEEGILSKPDMETLQCLKGGGSPAQTNQSSDLPSKSGQSLSFMPGQAAAETSQTTATGNPSSGGSNVSAEFGRKLERV